MIERSAAFLWYVLYSEYNIRDITVCDEFGLNPLMSGSSGQQFETLVPLIASWESDTGLATMSLLLKSGWLTQQTEDHQNPGFNTAATGFHYFLIETQCFDHKGFCSHYSFVLKNQEFETAGVWSRRDRSDCWCSEGGCTSILAFFKDKTYEGEDDNSGRRQVLRFLTFEALEMTQTCCRLGNYKKASKNSQAIFNFSGDKQGIHDEGMHLHNRLNALLDDFNTKFKIRGEGLHDFVMGH
ncbi:hypothetical protein F4860DRAFT_529303 [Xylaria cubensis]|nr:hypothetical protein F4860DRAFT_529303 [Xylaria cubensis]